LGKESEEGICRFTRKREDSKLSFQSWGAKVSGLEKSSNATLSEQKANVLYLFSKLEISQKR
jgi:hypothetical protein